MTCSHYLCSDDMQQAQAVQDARNEERALCEESLNDQRLQIAELEKVIENLKSVRWLNFISSRFDMRESLNMFVI